MPTLSATNLATHHHLSCDLYLHYLYHGTNSQTKTTPHVPSELSKAQFERGLGWEAKLYKWLDEQELLLTVVSGVVDTDALQALIDCDERERFFITGIEFWPPNEDFKAEFERNRTDPVLFGLAKPDLLEIVRTEDGSIVWRIIDAKASKEMKVRLALSRKSYVTADVYG
jgi:hypothetical protein